MIPSGSVEYVAPSRWCRNGVELVELLRDSFGREQILIRSPYHLQVCIGKLVHNIWIDGSGGVKFRLADQAGTAIAAQSIKDLVKAIRGFDRDSSDLVNMQRALELSRLIESARRHLPLCGGSQAAFVDAGFKNGQGQIGVVEVRVDDDGEHVRAESQPCQVKSIHYAEVAAIQLAVMLVAKDVFIFSDNQSAVQKMSAEFGDRIRWLPRDENKAADKVANMRGTASGPKKRRSGKRKNSPE
jgi:hypothetical protein